MKTGRGALLREVIRVATRDGCAKVRISFCTPFVVPPTWNDDRDSPEQRKIEDELSQQIRIRHPALATILKGARIHPNAIITTLSARDILTYAARPEVFMIDLHS